MRETDKRGHREVRDSESVYTEKEEKKKVRRIRESRAVGRERP